MKTIYYKFRPLGMREATRTQKNAGLNPALRMGLHTAGPDQVLQYRPYLKSRWREPKINKDGMRFF